MMLRQKNSVRKINSFLKQLYNYIVTYPDLLESEYFKEDLDKIIRTMDELKTRAKNGENIESEVDEIIEKWWSKYNDPPEWWKIKLLDTIREMRKDLELISREGPK